MIIRKASGEEMLRLWGCRDKDHASPTALYFYRNISSGNAVFFTIEHDGELIGELYAFLDLEEDRELADGKTTAYLCAFRVRRDYRGRGLGTRMMEKALDDLKAMGFSCATIGADDERHINLYRRMGFTREIKTCRSDPCARDEMMKPEPVEPGFLLMKKDL